MKNFIPLILAVLLGLAAVLAVGRLLAARKMAAEKMVSVVAAARAIAEGEIVAESYIMRKEIPEAAVPAQAIYWSRASMVVGQKALRSILQGDYVLLPDVGLSSSMGNIVGEGEWAVSLAVAPTGISRLIQAGDEVAVIGTFNIVTRIQTADLSAAAKEVEKEATMVLFPRVRVLDAGNLQSGPDSNSGGSNIVLALPPSQAQMLIAAQRQGELTLALRRPNDDTNINRLDAGMVDEQSFAALLQDLQTVKVPNVPSAVEKQR